MIPLTPFNEPFYTLEQAAEKLGWSKHNTSQRAPLCGFERIASGIYTQRTVDRYILARELTEQARIDGYTARGLLWPDENGKAFWGGHVYSK